MRKETQEVRGLRRALAEAYLSERAARKKELVAVRAKEAALREMQATLAKRLDALEAKTKELDTWADDIDDWRGEWQEGYTLIEWTNSVEEDISDLEKKVGKNTKDIEATTSRLRSKFGW